MLIAAHLIAFADDAGAARRFFSDVLGLPSVDAGGGWPIFAMPPTELAVHPGGGWGEREGAHRLFLVCDDIESTVAELTEKGVEFTDDITREDWGLVTMLKVPGHGEIGLYQPTHASPLEGVGTD
jgi:catechol 2,3-dioxygenase-like lactoylglutathione lyase family enzyme